MALTIATVTGADYVAGNKRVKVRDITFDNSYPTGGESLTASDVGLKNIEQVIPNGPAVDSDGTGGTHAVPVSYDYSTSKLQAWEVPDLDGNAATNVVLNEVGNTDSLANYLVRITFIGY